MTRIHPSQQQGSRLSGLTLALPLLLGLMLRLWFVFHVAIVDGDTLLYGDIAKNWFHHGIYGFTQATAVHPHALPLPTLIRLPGYPAFLALCFVLFGREHYTAVMLVQVLLDLATCLILARLSGRLFGRRSARAALWLAALCPFTGSYVATPLAETFTLLCIALAFDALHRWQQRLHENTPYNRWLYLLAASLAYAILLRPEQGLLAAAILPAMLWIAIRHPATLQGQPRQKRIAPPPGSAAASAATQPSPLTRMAPVLLVALLPLLPLAPWTLRNWRTFHVLQPLAPRSATDPGESIPVGFQHWYRSWAIDFASTEDAYWNYDGARIEIADLPNRAFDTQAQYTETADLLADYNQTTHPTAALDARFEALARQRIQASPIRYYLALPVARLLNMLLRPRTEMLPLPLEWWRFSDHPGQTLIAAAYAALNLAYLVFGAIGLRRWYHLSGADRRGAHPWIGNASLASAPLFWSMLAFILLRTALLLTLDNSEPRYTLEFLPVLIVAIAALFHDPALAIPSKA